MSDVKITFEKLTKVLEDKNSNFDELYRSKELKVVYDDYLEDIKNQWGSSSDLILSDVFGFKVETGENGKKIVDKTDLNKRGTIYKITKNKFPYNFTNNVVHYLVWVLNGEVTQSHLDETIEIIQKENKNRKIKNKVHWVNPPAAKSILDVEHAHIVVEFED